MSAESFVARPTLPFALGAGVDAAREVGNVGEERRDGGNQQKGLAGATGGQNQHLVFAIDPPARSRINTGYMVVYFLGGAIGSATAGAAWQSDQWAGVITLGCFYSGLALMIWIFASFASVRRSVAVPG